VLDNATVAHQPAVRRPLAPIVNRRYGVAGRQADDLFPPGNKKWIGEDNQRADSLLGHRRESRLQTAFAAGGQHPQFTPARICGRLRIPNLGRCVGMGWIGKHG